MTTLRDFLLDTLDRMNDALYAGPPLEELVADVLFVAVFIVGIFALLCLG